MPEKKAKEHKGPITFIGKVEPREIVAEMRESYLDYAMSVIVSRALPDVRDGLKPVHRRILYAMHDMGLVPTAKFRKSATVVGETLGKYHPHGDMAVYDSMVRMAQDFSLRYMLVTGQGNFGCFTADTKVKLTDGRSLSFSDLIKENSEGKINFTYAVNKDGLIQIAQIKNPRKTRENAEILKVVLDNGEEIKCTLNHKFLLKDGTYKEAQYLKEGESLMPLYERLSTEKDDSNAIGYEMIFQPKLDVWNFAHVLSDEWNLANKKYGRETGRIRHHIDFNKLNNNPDNIKRLGWKEHWKIHYEIASNRHKFDNVYRQKIADGRKKFWDDEKNREEYSKRLSERNSKNWKNSAYRERMREFLSAVNKEYLRNHPEAIERISSTARDTMTRLWKIPAYKNLFHEKIVASNKKRETNLTGQKKFLNICSYLQENNISIDKNNYETARKEIFGTKSFTGWDLGIKKYFNGDKNLILFSLNKNHKVSKIQILKEFVDVYDITIDEHHNFALACGIFVHNSIDGDPAAAPRYTECKLSKIGENLLSDIEKDTVDFMDNYDATRKEPMVLPSPLPQLLLNGSFGIAVGMATSIPTHNLSELCDALAFLLENEKADTEDLFQFIKGPDFPTGGIIYGKKNIIEAYSQGKGPMLVRGKAEIFEKEKTGMTQIIISEIPFQVQKSSLVEQFANLVQEKRIIGIKDIRDESDRDGMRIVIDLQKGAFPQKILNRLYKFTDLQKNFHLNMLALVDGIQPRVLALSDCLKFFIEHRKKVVYRRTQFELNKAKDRVHILEGLHKCLDAIDEVIKIIRASKDRDEAKANLIKRFKLSDIQANAILETKLSALAKLERLKIEEELKALLAKIKEYEAILKSAQKIKEIIKKELIELKANFGDERKTKIVATQLGEIAEEDLIPQEDTIITLTQGGYIKRINPETYKLQKRGGKGILGMKTMQDDIVEHFSLAQTHDNLFFFVDSGKVFSTLVYEIPEGTRVARGRGLLNFLELDQNEKVLSLLTFDKKDTDAGVKDLVMITQNGVIKRTPLDDFKNVRKSGLIAIKLNKGDALKKVVKSAGDDDVVIITKKGQSVRFKEKQIREMGRPAAGVRGISLKKGDAVVGMDVIKKEDEQKEKDILVVMENGYGKRTPVKEYRLQGRGGSGIKTANVTPKTGEIIFSKVLNGDEEDLIVISRQGHVIRTEIKSIPKLSRDTQGVRIMRLEDDKVASAMCI